MVEVKQPISYFNLFLILHHLLMVVGAIGVPVMLGVVVGHKIGLVQIQLQQMEVKIVKVRLHKNVILKAVLQEMILVMSRETNLREISRLAINRQEQLKTAISQLAQIPMI